MCFPSRLISSYLSGLRHSARRVSGRLYSVLAMTSDHSEYAPIVCRACCVRRVVGPRGRGGCPGAVPKLQAWRRCGPEVRNSLLPRWPEKNIATHRVLAFSCRPCLNCKYCTSYCLGDAFLGPPCFCFRHALHWWPSHFLVRCCAASRSANARESGSTRWRILSSVRTKARRLGARNWPSTAARTVFRGPRGRRSCFRLPATANSIHTGQNPANGPP
jgi:hypothetical protein